MPGDINKSAGANSRIHITDKQKEYLLSNYTKLTLDELSKGCNVSVHKIKGWLKELGIQREKLNRDRVKEVVTSGYFVHHDYYRNY